MGFSSYYYTILATKSYTYTTLFASLLSFILFYAAALVIYRLYFSPLCSFPGPQLTALTQWYETYCEIFKNGGGQFAFQIHKWHETYGPVVRINPFELHVSDPEFYETIYSTSEPFDKMKAFERRFNAPYASFSTTEHELHRQRRAALSPYFARRNVLQYISAIRGLADKLCDRLAKEYAGNGQVLVLDDLYTCFSADTITHFAFGQSHGFIEATDFHSKFTSAIQNMEEMVHYTTQFPWLLTLANLIPDAIMTFCVPTTKPVVQYQRDMDAFILNSRREVYSDRSTRNSVNAEDSTSRTVLDDLFESDLPPHELSVHRLQNETMGLLAAGIQTTKTALAVASFHILKDPVIYDSLKSELICSIPNPLDIPPLPNLEKLPYLSACVEEALRLSYGAVSRSPRVSHTGPIQYQSWLIPKEVPVSIQTYTMHHNEDIFPDSFSYKPERWLGNPKGPSNKKNLSRYMTAFGRGTRICLGMHLAYAEIFVVLATLFRRFDLALFDTDESAVRCSRAALGPQTKRGNLGVRAVIHRGV